MLAFYRALIAVRRRLAPLRNGRKDLTKVEWDDDARWLTIHRGDDGGGATFTCANLGDAPARLRLPDGKWTLALATDVMPEPASAASAASAAPVAVAPSTAAIYERVA